MSQTYTIQINEEQRAHIAKCLRDANPIIPVNNDSIFYLLSMFEELPKQEQESPKVLHGFCS